MKYIDAELLQKEIERQIMGIIKKQDANPDMPKYRWYLYEGMKEAFNDIGDFIDTLPDEPVSDCHDLAEAAETKYPTRWKKYPNDGIVRSEEYFDLNAEKRDAFKAGAEWDAEHFRDTTKKVSEDLEEAAEEYADYNSRRWHEDGDIYYDHSKIQDAFLAGADWQKEQMMKDAAEGEVVKDISNKLAVTAKDVNLAGFKFGDKVRIIILPKEEEQ